MLIISYAGITATLLMREPGPREVKPLDQCQTSSQWWCENLHRRLLDPTQFLLCLRELATPGGTAGGSTSPITHSTEDRVCTQERG